MEDRTATGAWAPGGPSLYTAVAAARLGASVALLTRVTPGYDRSVFDGLQVLEVAAASVPRYANSYGQHGGRTQVLLDEGEPLDLTAPFRDSCDATILAPAFHEIRLIGRPSGLLAVALQGALRSRAADGAVTPGLNALERTERFLAADYLALSFEDTPHADSFACQVSRSGPAVIVTRGADGAELFHAGRRRAITAVRAAQVDPTGAGDCFLAAFVVRLIETGDEREAGRFAAAAGALAVEGSGVGAIPSRTMIEARLREVAA